MLLLLVMELVAQGVSLRPETILLAEDDATVRATAACMLRALGYRLLEARDSEEALHIGEEHSGRIDLLLSSVVMPRISGPELALRLRSYNPGVRVLFLSRFSADSFLAAENEDPQIAFLPKPFSMESLSRMVREALDSPGPKKEAHSE